MDLFLPRVCRLNVGDNVLHTLSLQVKVWSSKVFKVQIVDDEKQLQELEHFSVVGWMHSLLREQQNETTIHVDLYSTKTCFKIDPTDRTQYTVKPTRGKLSSCYYYYYFSM